MGAEGRSVGCPHQFLVDPDLVEQVVEQTPELVERQGDRRCRRLRDLARIREEAGDSAGAEALAVQAADRGDARVLRDLAWMRKQAGDSARAVLMRKFGLTGSGEVATVVDFGS
jgi:hypothetical protein